MASADTQEPAETSALPDYVLDADAVLKDANVTWRYGKAPDYSRTRQMWAESKHDSFKLKPSLRLQMPHLHTRSRSIISETEN
jgi:hypothetical protein